MADNSNVKRFSSYTTIQNNLINDPALNWQDLGLLVYLLSKPDSYDLNIEDLAKERNLSIKGIQEILERLLDAGYASVIVFSPLSEARWTVFDVSKKETL